MIVNGIYWEGKLLFTRLATHQKRTRHCETSPQTGRGNPLDLPAFSLEIVTIYHSSTGLPRAFGPRNDVVIYALNNNLSHWRFEQNQNGVAEKQLRFSLFITCNS